MIIQANNTIYKYTSSQILDLMSPPSPDSDRQLYNDYYDFIKSIDAIYGTQDAGGVIPVFRTRQSQGSDILFADPDSTLRYLIPNQSYLFIVNSDANLPLKIPNPIGFKDFITNIVPARNSSIGCCPVVDVDTSVRLNQTSGNTYIIRADILEMLSNEKYFYEIKPIFSNWPAKLSVQSGEIVVPSKPDTDGKVSGHLESIFSFYEYLTDDTSESIPYLLNKSTTNLYYNKNIYSILNISIYNNKCILYDKNITITCSACIDNNICPDITMSSSGSGKIRYITTALTNLQHNTQYAYEFTTDSSNLVAKISPISGIVSKGIDQNSMILYSAFQYCDSNDDNCNLEATISDSYADPSVSASIYTNLIFNLYPINNSYCDSITANTLIQCDRCFVSNNFKTSVKFSNPSGIAASRSDYPILGDGIGGSFSANMLERPSLEYNLYTSGTVPNSCCDKPAVLQLNISNAIPGDKYTYDFTSYPQITIIPSTGIVSFGNGSGSISVLGYIENQKSSSVHVVLTHEKSSQKASDATIIRCPEPW